VRWCDVDLKLARIRVPAASAKSRREQSVEIPPDLLRELRAIAPRDRAVVTPVFDRTMFPSTRTFWKDLEEAGIARRDGEGRVVDFHSLRVTFVTWLVVSGVHPKTAQVLARHASIETTMQTYTDIRRLDVKAAVAGLPDLSSEGSVDLVDEGIGACPPAAAVG
jgi:integrase